MFAKKPENKLNKYIDPTGEFTNRELKLSEWYVAHKLTLRKIGLSALFIFCLITVGYSLIYWGYYFSTGYWRDENMLANQVLEIENYDTLKRFYAPRPLQIGGTEVYQTVSPANYDLAADLVNNNERWAALVEYKFVFDGGETPPAQAVILPGARPLAYFGFESNSFPAGAKLAIKNTVWRSLDRHVYPDLKNYLAERNRWEVLNFEFSPASRLKAVPANSIEFDLANASPYNFWRANFYVELLNDGERVGLIFLPEEKFLAGETRHVDERSFVEGLMADDVRIYPLINFFDAEEYMRVGGETKY